MSSKRCTVFVSKPKENKKTFNAELLDDVDGEIIYGAGGTAREAIADMLVMVEEINQSRANDGKTLLELTYDYRFDIAGLFSFYSYLNITEVARKMGINPGLMRRYASGETVPSNKRLHDIEDCLKGLADELSGVCLMTEHCKSHVA
ncbi:MAG: helix-turn-helix transcriptional regulator [Bacteroidaceae bacterium]|nr:helix-turn-helix transcriptional regulator [Bacteroidaceae bacterium]